MLKISVVAIFIASNAFGGPIWQAMDLFEQGKFAESSVIFEPYCDKSPVAFYYCKYLAEKKLLASPEIDAITDLKDPWAKIADEYFTASLAYYKSTHGKRKDKEKSFAHLLSLAEKSKLGSAFYLIAKFFALPEAYLENGQPNQSYDAHYPNAIPGFDALIRDPRVVKLVQSISGQSRYGITISILYRIAFEKFEFRSVQPMSIINNNFKSDNRVQTINSLFAEDKLEHEAFYEMSKNTTYDSDKDIYLEMSALFGGLKPQKYLGMGKNDQNGSNFWSSWAAQQGDSLAQEQVINEYLNSKNIKKDPAGFYKHAVKSSSTCVVGKISLGHALINGFGTPKNFADAEKILTSAYEQALTNEDDNHHLPSCLMELAHVNILLNKHEEAIKFYLRAYEQHGIEYAGIKLLELTLLDGKLDLFQGLDIAFKLTKSQEYRYDIPKILAQFFFYPQYNAAKLIEENQKSFAPYSEALDKIFKDCIKKNPVDFEMLLMLGRLYFEGGFLKPDLALAESYLKRAYAIDKHRAIKPLMRLYVKGFKDLPKAFHYYQDISEPPADLSFYLGSLIYFSRLDDACAVNLFYETLKVDKNSLHKAKVAWRLVLMHNGACCGLSKDGDEMVRLLKIASENGMNVADRLGDFYFNGYLGVKQDLELAQMYYQKAIEEGHEYGQLLLATVKRFKEGSIDPKLLKQHNLFSFMKKEKYNKVLNLILRHAESKNVVEKNKELVKPRHRFNFGNRKAIRFEDFRNLFKAHGIEQKNTKKGVSFRYENKIFSTHTPHKYGHKISGKALREGIEFFKQAVPKDNN